MPYYFKAVCFNCSININTSILAYFQAKKKLFWHWFCLYGSFLNELQFLDSSLLKIRFNIKKVTYMFIFAFNNLKSNTYEIWRPDASYKSTLIKYVARERYLLSISAFIIY